MASRGVRGGTKLRSKNYRGREAAVEIPRRAHFFQETGPPKSDVAATFASQKHAGAVGCCRCPAPEDELSEHRDGCSSRERRRRASPKPQPSPAACALPASFATAAARQNIDRRICRQRRNGEAEHATKLVITHIASLLCRSSSLRTSPNRTEGAGSIDPIKLSAKMSHAPIRCSSLAERAPGSAVVSTFGPILRKILPHLLPR